MSKKKEDILQYDEENNIQNIQNPTEQLNYEIENKAQDIKALPASTKNINNRNINLIEDELNLNIDNNDNYDSDIDDPKYRLNSDLYQNQNGNEILIDENINNNYMPNNYDAFQNNINQNTFSKSLHFFKYHNYDHVFKEDNLIQNKSILELHNENALLKEELYKRAEIIKNKDETISEFLNLLTTFKTRFEQYEIKNNKLKQHILILEKQLKSKKK